MRGENLTNKVFLHDRIRRAHSNVDFLWLDYIKNIGGVNGILKLLSTSYTMIDDNMFRKEEQLIGLLTQCYGGGGMCSFIDGDMQ